MESKKNRLLPYKNLKSVVQYILSLVQQKCPHHFLGSGVHPGDGFLAGLPGYIHFRLGKIYQGIFHEIFTIHFFWYHFFHGNPQILMETIVEALGPWIACKQSLSHSLNIHRCHRKTQSASVAASIPFLVRGHIFLLDPLFHALNNVKFHLSMAEIYHSPWLSSSFCFFLWSAGALGDPAQLSGDLSDELNAVAEQLWKDELAKGIKPKASAVETKEGML